jgi:outer membrane protein assembly factor BamE
MQKRLIPLFFLALAGCSTLEFPWVYRIDVDQGNIIEQEMVDQLKPGMSRSQVQFVMGSALIADTFNDDRWDYIYTVLRGDGSRERKRLSVFFENDRLVGLNGDFLPGGSASQ